MSVERESTRAQVPQVAFASTTELSDVLAVRTQGMEPPRVSVMFDG